MTWGLAASSWFFETSVVLASAVLFLVCPLTQRPLKQPLVEAELGSIIMIQSTDALGRFFCPGFARAVRTWKFCASFPHGLVLGSPVSGVWVLP